MNLPQMASHNGVGDSLHVTAVQRTAKERLLRFVRPGPVFLHQAEVLEMLAVASIHVATHAKDRPLYPYVLIQGVNFMIRRVYL